MTIDSTASRRVPSSAIAIWVLVAIGAVLVAVFAPLRQSIGWLPIVMAAGVIITFCVQLAIVRKEGLVNRVILSLSGALVILLLTTAALGAMLLATA